MQEEIEHKTVNFAISTVKLSARTLLKGAQFFLRQYDKSASQGKQSMKRLIRQNRGVTNLEIEKTGIKDFDRCAKRYHIDYGEKIHSSQIISSVSGKNVISRETDANGQVTTYSVKGIVSRDTNEKSIVPYAIRTDNYSISLVGKKVTIASAAMAITLVSNYIPTTGAEDIIKKAIVVVAGAVGAGVACLPDYLYVTSVLSMHKSVGKIYYVYENDYYLDSNKSQLIGHWTFRHRSGH